MKNTLNAADFRPDFWVDFKILAENHEKIQAENIERKILTLFRSCLAQKSGENLWENPG